MADAPKAHPPWAGRTKTIINMYYTYILFSNKLKKRYIGSSANLKQRLEEHNSGKSTFSSKGRPWKLIYYEAFENKSDALREERFLKTGKGRERIKFLFKKI